MLFRSQSPFIKVEASKFTEVGYVGRDVESMVRDLVELAVDMVRAERVGEVREKGERQAEERLLDLLLPPGPVAPGQTSSTGGPDAAAREQGHQTRERMREQLRAGRLDTRVVELEVTERGLPGFEVVTGPTVGMDLGSLKIGRAHV